jgi:DNA-binding NtrC family response regulator
MRLMIVDNRRLGEILRDWLQTKNGPDGDVFSVELEADYGKAAETVSRMGNRYDAVLIDDPPERGDPELALQVIRACWKRRLTGIMFTADAHVRRCVEVMRAGGWDYLRKEAPETLLENILQSLTRAAEHRQLLQANPDAAWIDAHLDELTAQHAGQYVVVHGGAVVESSRSYADVAAVVRSFKATPGARLPVICHVPRT